MNPIRRFSFSFTRFLFRQTTMNKFFGTRGKIFALMVAIVLVLQACVPDQAPLISIDAPQPSPTPPATNFNPLATVTFQVEVPLNTPQGQPILFTILDEVTGLALNLRREEMEKVGDQNYSITLPFPVGAVVKYRYAHQDDHIAEEHTTDGRPVRYRLYRVDGPGSVHDVVSNWSDSTFSGETGRIKGQVIDAISNEPIPNILVAAGGAQTTSASNGDFLIEGLPPGTHNLVLYAYDGSYRTFQQGASVAANSTTPAPVEMNSAPLVKVIFAAQVPEGTLPAIPIRIAGSLTQFGNTFSNLAGGMNTLASRMPLLTQLPSGLYALGIELPAGAYLEYKYTLGDGFWNSEHGPGGEFKLRTLTVPEEDILIEDRIDNWGESSFAGPIIFNVTIPDSTPEFDYVSIQFNPFSWTEPIPMWDLGQNHWVYMLYSPLTSQSNFSYRYCRNDQCGRADDILTPGENHPGRMLTFSQGTQSLQDNVEAWYWMDSSASITAPEMPNVEKRGPEFITGIELQPHYHPSWIPRLPVTFNEIANMQPNWVFLSPTWTFSRQYPPVFEPVSGVDSPWHDLVFAVERGQAFGMRVALNPTANFYTDLDSWWLSSSRDFPWWQVWFERYANFLYNFADFAQQNNVDALVIGGEWVSPALPGGTLADGSPSGVPADAESRWRTMIAEVRNRYDGTLIWALPAYPEGLEPPPFVEDLDRLYLLWSLPLADQDAEAANMETLGDYLDREVFPIIINLEMPTTIAATYPSAKGGLQGCVRNLQAEDLTSCVSPVYLEPPYQDDPNIELSLDEQLAAFHALLSAINERDWLDGFVARGYYPPAPLQDKSSSINGKPAQTLVADWFHLLAPSVQGDE
jgi:hypothetical protein